LRIRKKESKANWVIRNGVRKGTRSHCRWQQQDEKQLGPWQI